LPQVGKFADFHTHASYDDVRNVSFLFDLTNQVAANRANKCGILHLRSMVTAIDIQIAMQG
jgi:hypothetical protein